MPTIAISYRRSDSSAIAGRIYDRLAAHYGENNVFMDIDNIPLGIDFRTHIHETLQRTDVLIAVIGMKWLVSNADGTLRMREETDPVRVEIETALARKTTIIPVLVDGARMPDSADLPPEFGNFAFLNAAEVATGRDFRSHMERLIGAIDRTTSGNVSAATTDFATVHTQTRAVEGKDSALQSWLNDVLRGFAVPLVLLLVMHHVLVNAYDLNVLYLQMACVAVPLASGAIFSRTSVRGGAPAIAMAIALGIVADAGMTISQSLYSGDPVMPQTRIEWWDNFNFAAIIALSYSVGYTLTRMMRAILKQRPIKS
jgi:TIR domain